MGLAKQVQQLRYYLSATGPEMNSKEPSPVDMEEYGFGSSAQLLDIVSSVSPDSRITCSMLMLMTLRVNSSRSTHSPSRRPLFHPLASQCHHSSHYVTTLVTPTRL